MRAHGLLRGLVQLARRLSKADPGSIAIKFAVSFPALALFTIGAIDLTRVQASHVRLQGIADAAALTAAPSLALATEGVVARQRAEAYVEAMMAQWEDAPAYEGAYDIVGPAGERAIRVRLSANRPSFFVNMMPPGGWDFVAEATASPANIVPLCVLSTAPNGDQGIRLQDSARLIAPACLIHSNRNIQAHGISSILAASVQAVRRVQGGGTVSPSALVGAAPIADPLATLDLRREEKINRVCSNAEKRQSVVVSSGTHRVAPGRHCGGIEASGTARIILEPGDHFFVTSRLEMSDDARLEGTDVAAIFDAQSRLEFSGRARVSLDGRQSGPYGGIVLAATRNNTQTFTISSDNVESLLGVVYFPEARFQISGASDVARESDWTVIVAKQFHMTSAASVFVNANYEGSVVPVPAGVGPQGGAVRLTE